MIRPRKKGKPAVPNLYEDGGYYSWRHPVTGKTYGLGRNRQAAIHQAIEANLHVEELIAKPRLLDRLTDDADRTVARWIERYESEVLPERDYKRATERLARAMGRAVVKAHGEFHIARWTPLHANELIRSYARQGKRQMALQLRSYLIDLCGEAVNAGWLPSNIAANIRTPKVTVQRARLALEDFLAIYAKAGEIHHPWVQRAMELALVTGQRREDLAAIEFAPSKTAKSWVEGSWMRVIQQKTKNTEGARIAIPLSLRLQAVNWSVGEVVSRCRDNVLSRFLLHHSHRGARIQPGDPIGLQSLTRTFSEALKASSVAWEEGRTPPSFHEIRSLSKRLYDQQGTDTKALLGHKSDKIAATYADPREPRWIEVTG
jgi:hypothetical protein